MPPTTLSPNPSRSATSGTDPLRVVYVGPSMDLVLAAYRPEHDRLRHSARHVRFIDDVHRFGLRADVAIINPLVETINGIHGACALQTLLSPNTLVVALYTTLGPAHAMFTKHALGGRCHPRMLLHYPDPNCVRADVVDQIDQMARGKGGGTQVRTTGHLPTELLLSSAAKDLGQIMEEDAATRRTTGDGLTLSLLLYTAANEDWGTWGDLANLLGYAEGHVKNTKARLGRDLRKACLRRRYPNGDNPAASKSDPWRLAEFVRFVTENSSFIRAYYEQHLTNAVSVPHPTAA